MRISIIVPTLNEAARIWDCLQAARQAAPMSEIIVVDGGSLDETRTLARKSSATVISSKRGRGQQLSSGARVATGDILLFLHADTMLQLGTADALGKALADPNISGGNFRVIFRGDSRFARWLTRFYAWFRGHGLYYGDSAIFIRREVLTQIGGIHPLSLMEDFDLNRRMERFGGTICVDEPAVTTSARRFEGRHPALIFMQWLSLHALYYLRLPSARLARVYDSERGRTAP
jgi:rSAM/selenodomain-associated transferase 2